MLKGKHIVLGITGGIAAYKAAILVRMFVKEGAEVQVVMTAYAKKFITPLTMATLSKKPVLVEFFNPENGQWNSHVDLGLWADAYVVAPATANTLGKMANGIADNLLLTSYLSARCPVFVAPAMDLDMFQHPTTCQNLNKLKSFGVHVIEPASGELASGLDGKGRMEEPEKILQYLIEHFNQKKTLLGKNIVITAGPTYELIDPVRYIGNFSSGKMGYALAEMAQQMGANVTLISGPVSLEVPAGVEVQRVTSANEMHNAVSQIKNMADIIILAAAVADFKVENMAGEKIKTKEKMVLQLTETVDIAREIGAAKNNKQILVGFALETNNQLENAKRKLHKKNFDFIVLNSLQDKNATFGYDTNKITIINKKEQVTGFDLKPKKQVAADILNYLVNHYLL